MTAASVHLRIDPTAHVADKASLHTSSHHPHPIVIGAYCVIHPFARLDSASGPILLGDRCVLWEKTTLGRPRRSLHSGSTSEDDGIDDEIVRVQTITIGDDTVLQPHAKVSGPATIGAKCNIGIGVEVGTGAVLGEGVTVASGTYVREGSVLEKDCAILGQGPVHKPGKHASANVQQDLQMARAMRDNGEERHRVLMTKLVKGTAGGTRFTN